MKTKVSVKIPGRICLMGDKVEPRKEFIYEHSLEVKDLDI